MPLKILTLKSMKAVSWAKIGYMSSIMWMKTSIYDGDHNIDMKDYECCEIDG